MFGFCLKQTNHVMHKPELLVVSLPFKKLKVANKAVHQGNMFKMKEIIWQQQITDIAKKEFFPRLKPDEIIFKLKESIWRDIFVYLFSNRLALSKVFNKILYSSIMEQIKCSCAVCQNVAERFRFIFSKPTFGPPNSSPCNTCSQVFQPLNTVSHKSDFKLKYSDLKLFKGDRNYIPIGLAPESKLNHKQRVECPLPRFSQLWNASLCVMQTVMSSCKATTERNKITFLSVPALTRHYHTSNSLCNKRWRSQLEHGTINNSEEYASLKKNSCYLQPCYSIVPAEKMVKRAGFDLNRNREMHSPYGAPKRNVIRERFGGSDEMKELKVEQQKFLDDEKPLLKNSIKKYEKHERKKQEPKTPLQRLIQRLALKRKQKEQLAASDEMALCAYRATREEPPYRAKEFHSGVINLPDGKSNRELGEPKVNNTKYLVNKDDGTIEKGIQKTRDYLKESPIARLYASMKNKKSKGSLESLHMKQEPIRSNKIKKREPEKGKKTSSNQKSKQEHATKRKPQ